MPRDPKLTETEVSALLKTLPNWRREGDALVRTYEFPTFREAVRFVDRVAELADQLDHHPDIDVRYRKVRLLTTTHDSKGLTARDGKLAAQCDSFIASPSGRGSG